jgi:hypothetical protein
MRPLILLAAAALLAAAFGPRPSDIPFEKLTLDLGANETAAFADLNGDKRLDLIAGENWYEAPKWTRHRFRELGFENNYIDNFSDLAFDVDGDGATDVVACSWFARSLAWWRNPGRGAGVWQQQAFETGSPIEFCFLVDLDNDGQRREVLPQFGNAKTPLAWFEYKGGKWAKHVVHEASMGHGIGAGDVNGDGRTDILTPKGWLEAPADPRASGWTFRPAWELGSTGFLHVIDLNGDKRPDVLGSMAHDYGIFWLEQDAGGKFTRRLIDESWSQAHATTLVDLNGDGRLDLLTGKRYMAHNGKDPGEKEPLGLYWYEQLPLGPKGQVGWVRHIIDYSTRSGGGMQLPVADIDGDGDLDFAAPGKSGLFLFINRTK